MTRITRITYHGFNETIDSRIREFCKECGLKEIESGFMVQEKIREIIFLGYFSDVHDEMELEDICSMYDIKILTS